MDLTKFFCLFVFLVSFSSCEKEEKIQNEEAILIWEGEYEVDGCGFFIEISTVRYKPENENIIGEEFKETGRTPVYIEFLYLNNNISFLCGDAPFSNELDGIKIISIKKL